jgi:putative hemolysin
MAQPSTLLCTAIGVVASSPGSVFCSQAGGDMRAVVKHVTDETLIGVPLPA